MTIYDDLRDAVEEIIADYKKANADGELTFSEIFTLVGNAVATFVQLAQAFGGVDGPAKKAAVLSAIEQFFDEVIVPIDIKGVPNFLEGIVDTALKRLVLTFAGSWIDSIVNIFNKTGWGDPIPPVQPPVTPPTTPSGDDDVNVPTVPEPGKPILPPGFEPY